MINTYYINSVALQSYNTFKERHAQGLKLSDFINARPQAEMKDGIATIHVTGVIANNPPPVHSMLGGSSYDEIATEIDEAIEAGATGILFSHDSPGGQVAGNAELAEKIADLDVPTVAFAKGLCCSASYKLAVGCDAIVARPSSEVGNVGTILLYVDDSAFTDKLGIKVHAITSDEASLKSTLHTMPVTDEQREFLQESITRSGNEFKDYVRANRAGIDEVFVKAGWYKGEQALALNFIDSVGNEQDARDTLTDMIEQLQRLQQTH